MAKRKQRSDKDQTHLHKVWSKEEVEEAARGSMGVYKYMAQKLITPNGTACQHYKVKEMLDLYPTARKIFDEEEEYVVNNAKLCVFRAVNSGDVKAAQWILSRLHPDKFSENVKVEGSQIITINYNFPDVDTEDNQKLKELIKKA